MKKWLKIVLIIVAVVAVIELLLIGLGVFMPIKATEKLEYNASKPTISSQIIDSYTDKENNYEINFILYQINLLIKIHHQLKQMYIEKYTLTTNEYYMIVTKIDTTVMFAKIQKEYKENVNNTFNKLGY